MKLTILPPMGARPFRPAVVTIFTIGLIGLGLAGANLLTDTQFGGVIMLLVGLGFKLIPPAYWLGGGLIVTLWLVVLYQTWNMEEGVNNV